MPRGPSLQEHVQVRQGASGSRGRRELPQKGTCWPAEQLGLGRNCCSGAVWTQELGSGSAGTEAICPSSPSRCCQPGTRACPGPKLHPGLCQPREGAERGSGSARRLGLTLVKPQEREEGRGLGATISPPGTAGSRKGHLSSPPPNLDGKGVVQSPCAA